MMLAPAPFHYAVLHKKKGIPNAKHLTNPIKCDPEQLPADRPRLASIIRSTRNDGDIMPSISIV